MNELKNKIMDILGLCVNGNYVFNADTLEPISVNKKALLYDDIGEIDLKRNIVFNLFDLKLISSLFKAYLALEEEDENLYIMTFYESVYDKLDQFSSSKLVAKDRTMKEYSTDYYYIPSFKYIAMMYILSEMYNTNELASYDSKDLVISYYNEQEKLKKRRKK